MKSIDEKQMEIIRGNSQGSMASAQQQSPGVKRAIWYEHIRQHLEHNSKSCAHEHVDTGMKRSWCKHCDADMEFCAETGEFKALA